MGAAEGMMLVAVGFATATVGTLIGVGGGFALMPFLLFYYPGLSPATATFINLCMVCANGTSGTVAYARMRRIDYRSGIAFAAAAAPAAILGVYVVRYVPIGLFAFIFGILLILVSGFIFARGLRKAEERLAASPGGGTRHLVDATGKSYHYKVNLPLGAGASVFVGFVSSFLGIGGGLIHVPLLTQVLRFPVHVATATSHFILAITALVGVLTHLAMGGTTSAWPQALLLAAGAIFGAQLGAWLAKCAGNRVILLILACGLALAGLRMALLGAPGW